MMNVAKSLEVILAHKAVPAGVDRDQMVRNISGFVQRYSKGGATAEDILSEALMALHKAIGAFNAGECSDVAKGFESFVWFRMREACRNFARTYGSTVNGSSRKRFDSKGDFSGMAGGEIGESILTGFEGSIPNPETLCIAKQAIESVQSAIERVQDQAKREVLKSLCDETETQAQLAKRLGISQQAISKKRKAALAEVASYVTDVQIEIGALA
jgi:RNA polymerase sigma factor (sigma-70 family)